MCDTVSMSKVHRVRTRKSQLASIHARAGCKLSVHGTKKRSHKDAGCKYVTHGPSPLSKLITPFSVQRKRQNTKTKKQQAFKRKGSPVSFDKMRGIINEILTPTETMTVRRSRRNRRVPKCFLQEGSGKRSNHMQKIEQARLIHQRRYGNPWMGNGYAARL